jgi:cytochrome bd-type quinol oxidase subunit 1
MPIRRKRLGSRPTPPISALPSAQEICRRSARGDARADCPGGEDTIPTVWPLFWAFRIMVALGFGFIATMLYFFYRASFKGMNFPRPALHLAVWMIPTPWIAAELGWFVAEFGRQPWTVDGVLPTAMSVSHLSMTEVCDDACRICPFYTVLFIIEMGLMLKYIRKGPFQDVEETDAWVVRHTEHRWPAGAMPMPSPCRRSKNHDPAQLYRL